MMSKGPGITTRHCCFVSKSVADHRFYTAEGAKATRYLLPAGYRWEDAVKAFELGIVGVIDEASTLWRRSTGGVPSWPGGRRPVPRGAEPYHMSLIKRAITGQNLRLGAVRPCSQFLTVSRLILNCAASVFLVRACLTQCARRPSESNFRFLPRGCESPLMALITRWQKGFETDPFRHCATTGCDANGSHIQASKRLWTP